MSGVSLKGKKSGKGSSSKIPRPTSAGTGTGSMYKMKPVVLPQVIELPQGMYRVSPVSIPLLEESKSTPYTCASVGSVTSMLSAPAASIEPVPVEKFLAIEKRQIEILNKLTHLREIIVGIHDNYEVEIQEGMMQNVLGVQEYIDIVVNANPKKAPFSILFLYKLLRVYYGEGVRLHNHIHSSINDLLPSYLTIFNKPDDDGEKSPTIILITLIWKETEEAELLVNPNDIRGEGNVAKFLSKLIPPVFPLNYDTLDPNTRSLVDGFVTQALNERTFTLDMVENYFRGRNNSSGFSLLVDGISIADFITYAAVARHLLKDLTSINLRKHPHVMRWLTTCQHYGEFELFTGDN